VASFGSLASSRLIISSCSFADNMIR
jgi:hypothetical protein